MAAKTILKFLFVSFLIKKGITSSSDDAASTEEDTDDLHEQSVDEGSNLTLRCPSPLASTDSIVEWIRERRNEHMTTREDGTLQLVNLKRRDSGVYNCYVIDGADNSVKLHRRILLHVRSAPPQLVNVTVHPSTILALLRWDVADSGGYPITHFTAQYRLAHTTPGHPPDIWHPVKPPRISASATQIDIYQLEPNSTYQFQVWANNKLGMGEVVMLEGCTHHDNQEIELGRHLLEGAETFDTRVWVVAVAVVMGTLLVLALGTCYALYTECRTRPHVPLSKRYLRIPTTSSTTNHSSASTSTYSCLMHPDDQETMELVPNIILNPGYHEDRQTEWIEPDENCNDTTTIRLNNNSVVQPMTYRV
ncbi:uncharacterized protein LOC111064545 [Nilaparvata lugens]|uniref:uncharacterized protein LOC111064545 n=1 Tax=Nilaparvata lugens TaxID=108931 RepID=UPI00193D8811|nr:uncharacterized protein LOC111064545 [Nilaparvata lugens]